MTNWASFSKTKKGIAALSAFLFIALTTYGLIYQSQKPKEETSPSPPPSADLTPPSISSPVRTTSEVKTKKLLQKISEESREFASEEQAIPQHQAPEPKAAPVERMIEVTPPPVESPKVEPATAPTTAPDKTPETQSSLIKDFWLWAGAGVNFTQYSQTVPGLSDVDFGRIGSPSQVFRSGFFFDESYALDLEYKSIPGKTEAGDSISVQNGSYEWKAMTAELLYRSASASEPQSSEWLWRLGMQFHQMPFIVPLTANSIEITSNNMTSLSTGIEYRKKTKKNIRIEGLLRYQHPVSSSSKVETGFKLTPNLTFDGSLGAAYEFKPNIYVGTYWHGQHHSYKFKYNSNSTTFSGSQNLFFTNFDIRLGVEF